MSKWKEPAIHVSIWSIVILLFMFTSGKGELTYRSLVVVGYFGLINIGVFYANYLYAIPRFLSKGRYLPFVLTLFFILLFSSVSKIGLRYLYDEIIFSPKSEITVNGVKQHVEIGFMVYLGSAVFVSCFFLFISTAAKFMADWFKNQKIQKELQNQKLSAELAFLKSQINPHFLFNSLNNIYSLAYQKSDKTPEAILKLSDILRYMLYESNDNKVSLTKEINYLESYIELQRLRFKEKAFVEYTLEGDPDPHTILPLVLISFVENAFKHGIANDAENPIVINLKITADNIYFQVLNKKSNLNKDETGGIGLVNVKRRLDLLYRGKYHIEIEDGPSFYHSELFLDLG